MVENYIIDATSLDFDSHVVRTDDKLVVVDFWAPWCGPCRSLKPILESLARSYGGAFVLVKINTEEYPDIAQNYDIRGIPDVRFFVSGSQVDSFTGLRGEAEIKDIIDNYTKDLLALFLEEMKDREDSISIFESKIPSFEKDARFQLAYAEALIALDRSDEALKLLQKIEPIDKLYDKAKNLQLILKIKGAIDSISDDDLGTKYKKAFENLLANRLELATELLLDVLMADKEYREGEAKQAALLAISKLTDKTQTNKYRRQLSMIINS